MTSERSPAAGAPIKYLVDGIDRDRTVYDEFDRLKTAEAYARARCLETGAMFFLVKRGDGHPEIVARVSRDNRDRVWTDVQHTEGALL
jgi:hypothetical protein